MPRGAQGRRPRRRWGNFPTTADLGIWATGGSPAELFEALGLGLFAVQTDLRRVQVREERALSASGADPISLTVAYLSELLLLQATEGLLVRSIEARLFGRPPTGILASVAGERYDPARHHLRIEVKAITLHDLRLDLDLGRARVIVDI